MIFFSWILFDMFMQVWFVLMYCVCICLVLYRFVCTTVFILFYVHARYHVSVLYFIVLCILCGLRVGSLDFYFYLCYDPIDCDLSLFHLPSGLLTGRTVLSTLGVCSTLILVLSSLSFRHETLLKTKEGIYEH